LNEKERLRGLSFLVTDLLVAEQSVTADVLGPPVVAVGTAANPDGVAGADVVVAHAVPGRARVIELTCKL
jgi:hypothetical protein